MKNPKNLECHFLYGFSAGKFTVKVCYVAVCVLRSFLVVDLPIRESVACFLLGGDAELLISRSHSCAIFA